MVSLTDSGPPHRFVLFFWKKKTQKTTQQTKPEQIICLIERISLILIEGYKDGS